MGSFKVLGNKRKYGQDLYLQGIQESNENIRLKDIK